MLGWKIQAGAEVAEGEDAGQEEAIIGKVVTVGIVNIFCFILPLSL